MYTTIIHPIRKSFNLSMNEYAVLDTIYHLSKNNKYSGWCIKSKQNIANDLDLSRQTIVAIIKTLEEKGLIDRGENDQLRTTDEWNSIISEKSTWSISNKEILSINFTDCKETLHQPVKKLYTPCKETLHNNNSNNNIDNSFIEKEEKKEVQPHIRIINMYFLCRGIKTTKEKYSTQIKPFLKYAKDLLVFEEREIAATMIYCSEKFQDWSLSAVQKQIGVVTSGLGMISNTKGSLKDRVDKLIEATNNYNYDNI